jgi:hypothetical protein
MGLYDFWVNTVQSGQIDNLEKRIEQLEEQNQILYEWVEYFKHRLKITDEQF